jgi:methionyl aminopeptidase
MIEIKDKQALDKMRQTGKLLAELFELLRDYVPTCTTTLDIDTFVGEYLAKHNMISCSRGYMGYRHVTCISPNEVVVHGVPKKTRKIDHDKDLIKVDVCASYNGYCADMARCFMPLQPSKSMKRLVKVAQDALDRGIESAQIGNRIGDISYAIQTFVEKHGYGIVRDFAGHGIGKSLHEAPEILNYGSAGTGPLIKQGMAFAIEPMITEGGYHVFVTRDGWTAKTVDKSLAAHVEDTVIITEDGPEIITRL